MEVRSHDIGWRDGHVPRPSRVRENRDSETGRSTRDIDDDALG